MPAKWRKLFGVIPGYDPIATRGDCTFHAKVADAVITWVEANLTHIEGELAGQPLRLEPWQAAIVGCAFGWFRPNGLRRYREVFEYIPRKNGKSTKLGALINLVALCDDEPGAQIYSAAAEREQAALVYRQAKGMLLNKPALESLVKIYATYKSIEYPGNTVYKALSADADTKHGFNSHFVAVDELHAHPNRELVDVLHTSMGSRRQPMMWYITTADWDRESICNEKYDYACKVRDRVIADPSFLPAIFEATNADDWTSEKTWRKANPNLGVSISLEYLQRECQRAQDIPGYENTFKRLHLNIRTQNDVRWLRIEDWDRGGAAFDEDALAGRAAYGALDLSSKLDVTAWVLVFPPTDEDPRWHVVPRFFVPRDGAEKRERIDRVPYMTWGRQGIVTLTDGNVVDYDFIKARIAEDAQAFDLQEIAYDPWNATQIALQLQDSGAKVVEFNQGFRSMSEPTKEFEKLIVQGNLIHGGNPVLRWMASNVSCETDPAGNLKVSKRKSTERIDGIVATIMAIGRAIASPPPTKSVYESRGILSF